MAQFMVYILFVKSIEETIYETVFNSLKKRDKLKWRKQK